MAISLISMIILSVTGLIILSLNTALNSKNDAIAANLAQEGIELVRNIRDTNWIQGAAFDNGLAQGDHLIDYQNGLSAFQDKFILFDSISGYQYTSGQDSLFKRKITITDTTFSSSSGAVIELKIESDVTWLVKSISHEVKAEERLWNWK